MPDIKKLQIAATIVSVVVVLVLLYYFSLSNSASVNTPVNTSANNQPTPTSVNTSANNQPTPTSVNTSVNTPTNNQSTPTTAAPTTEISQCKPCANNGAFACPGSLIKSTDWYNGQASIISNYRVAQYDPVTPPITIDGTGYYFRQLGTTC